MEIKVKLYQTDKQKQHEENWEKIRELVRSQKTRLKPTTSTQWVYEHEHKHSYAS